ncbi:uncharacterized protein LOC132194842 [Neocloeon triangulifer]|uniref:uncharacterized protein LOC132194842 n=1 Tax=Neocloeon triangulifer TaxID=2078957 RepID=UPI00286EBA91|nr:uncharacterized protein LOC132194842 [Neocloeon triangulifer]
MPCFVIWSGSGWEFLCHTFDVFIHKSEAKVPKLATALNSSCGPHSATSYKSTQDGQDTKACFRRPDRDWGLCNFCSKLITYTYQDQSCIILQQLDYMYIKDWKDLNINSCQEKRGLENFYLLSAKRSL